MTSDVRSTFEIMGLAARVPSFARSLDRATGEPEHPREQPHDEADPTELRVHADVLLESERRLESEREQYRELFNLCPDALLVTDLAAVVRSANAAATRMFECGATRLRGRTLAERIDPDDRPRFWEAMRRAATGAAEDTLWVRDRHEARSLVCLRGAVTRDGRRILWSARPTAPEAADEAHVDELTRSLAERDAQLAEALARCEGLEAQARSRDASLSLLAHELRGPTDVIIGWSRLLRGGGADESERARAMATIERNAVAQSVLVDDLVEASRLAAQKLSIRRERTDLGELARSAVDAVRAAAEQRSVTLSCAAEMGLMVLGDRARLTQVLSSLLSNALKATPGGGSIEVRCSLHDSHAGRRVVVEVIDTGVGIAPGELGHLFEYRRHDHAPSRRSSGLGLGLFLVRELVELHGGHASARSAGKGTGATFVVSLPAHAG
ncbi:MAG: PAS domain-containing protein [Myxococcaceae bacterium]|nr:MAG: PAS domain-containing protein [Myxococcaceae bacterium]